MIGRRAWAPGALAAALIVLAGTSALGAGGYVGSVRQAERYLAGPHPSTANVARALSVLNSGTACGQPEIAGDLQAKPPLIGDARLRLLSLDSALSHPARPAAGVDTQLRRLARTAPYQREQPESPGDLLTGWLQAREAALFGGCGGGWGALLLLGLQVLAVVVAVVAAVILVLRLLRGRLRAGEEEPTETAEQRRRRTAAERFAAADRLAAAGDLAAAIRELASAVATSLGGEAAWDVSPLTVREIFIRGGRLGELRPVLRGFEEAVYGHRPVTRETYDAAANAAAPFRVPARRAA